MRGYASKTTVSPDRSRAEIESLVKKYGATQFVSGYDVNAGFVGFMAKDRVVRFTVPLPKNTGSQREYEQQERTQWRKLLLAIKAKLESSLSGIETFEEAFLAQIIVPGNNETVGKWAREQLKQAYTGAKTHTMLALPPASPAVHS